MSTRDVLHGAAGPGVETHFCKWWAAVGNIRASYCLPPITGSCRAKEQGRVFLSMLQAAARVVVAPCTSKGRKAPSTSPRGAGGSLRAPQGFVQEKPAPGSSPTFFSRLKAKFIRSTDSCTLLNPAPGLYMGLGLP